MSNTPAAHPDPSHSPAPSPKDGPGVLALAPSSAPSCECELWCRPAGSMTNHHPNCPHYNDSLIDVWRVSYDGTSYVTDHEPTIEAEEIGGVETVTKEQMHREVFENLPDFTGF